MRQQLMSEAKKERKKHDQFIIIIIIIYIGQKVKGKGKNEKEKRKRCVGPPEATTACASALAREIQSPMVQ
jgi:hypothetical protein